MTRIIAICSMTCAGKTTLANRLAELVPGAVVLSFDEYDLFPTGSPAMDRELAKPTITNWEDPVLFDIRQFVADLDAIARGETVELLTRSRDSLNIGQARRLFVPGPLVIVEGLHVLLDPRARAHYTWSFFINVAMEVGVARRLVAARGGEGPWDHPDYITGEMVRGTREFVLPQQQHADVILGGRQSTEELAGIVMGYVG
jgi:uridine kinase